ncbi:MAG: hypothetical protein KAQ98_04150 [Bacteriovoracaceae bacterium]|nr:hypothetical protein [Bacteriovoracaceae bacterium]
MARRVILLFLFLLFAIPHSAPCQENVSFGTNRDWRSSVISDPGISTKCKRLIFERNEKIKFKQKISALIIRNSELQREVPPNKISVKKKLVDNLKKLRREQKLVILKLRTMTENIIKKGCPGIEL